jgi:Meckel syndrome type 1 protein
MGLMVLAAWPVKAAEGAADDTEAAAMARAKRQAANPMKAILAASKMKRKVVVEADLPAVTASPAAAALPSVASRTGSSATATAALSSANASNSLLLTQAVAAAEALPASKAADRITPTSDWPSAVAPTATVAPGWMQPRLVEMVEPAIPARVLDEIGQLVELQIDLSLRADGSVAAVTLLPPVPRQLARYVTAALERWRYAPLPAGQVHRVQLVFNER